MVKNGSSLGINVLSGLVKVDRIREPGKPRALSVRVFGVPVFSRGFNRGDPMPTDGASSALPGANGNSNERGGGGGGSSGSGGGGPGGEEEELPIDP